MACRNWRDCHQRAQGHRETEEPDAATYRNGRQRFGAQTAGHHCIRELHARDRQVVDDKRPGEAQQRFGLAPESSGYWLLLHRALLPRTLDGKS
jgi:hypothetical protein